MTTMIDPRTTIRSIVRGGYDLQKLRIQQGLRIVANYKAKLGQSPGEKEDDMDEESKDIIKTLRASHNRITDAITENPRAEFVGDELISDYAEFVLIDSYMKMLSFEQAQFKALPKILASFPIFTEFLDGVSGCGPMMSGVIISEIDIHKARHPSSLWKYAGLDVTNGEGRSRKAHHLVDKEYTNKEGEQDTRKSITFNPWLKTKLVGVLAGGFLKVKESPYKTMYYEYKNRLENHAIHKDKSKGHRHNMALRYIIKRFLCDLYVKWRTLEGLPVSLEYSEAKLGMKHVGDAA